MWLCVGVWGEGRGWRQRAAESEERGCENSHKKIYYRPTPPASQDPTSPATVINNMLANGELLRGAGRPRMRRGWLGGGGEKSAARVP